MSSPRCQDRRTVKSETKKLNVYLKNIPTNNITELNDLIYAGGKFVVEKNSIIPKITDKVKTWIGTLIRIVEKKNATSSKNIETVHKIYSDSGKSTTARTKNTTQRDCIKITDKRKNTEKIQRQDQTI